YTFVCDVHPTMKGAFTVGTVPVPVPVHKLAGAVGPGARIVLARAAPAGKAKITIRDRSAKDNFHLSGPGVNTRTGVMFMGTVTWTVTLKPGRYSFRSDKHPKLHGTLTVS